MKTYKHIFMTALIMLLALPTMTVSADDPTPTPLPLRSAAITLTDPSPNSVALDSEITLDLFFSVENINPGVAGADIYLKYNDSLVTPIGQGALVNTVLPNFFGVPFSANIVTLLPAALCPNNSDGPCIHLVIAGTPQFTKSALIARFQFRSIAAGNPCFSVTQSTLVDSSGFNVIHTPAVQKCGNIAVRAAITGIVQKQGTLPGRLACSRVTVGGFGPALTDSNGSFTLPNLPAGTYPLSAVYSGYLSSQTTITITASNPPLIGFGATTLRGGDVVGGDNIINILDIGAIASPANFGRAGLAVGSSSPNCSIQDNAADINDDGQVNISDLAIAAGNWSTPGPTIWQPQP